MTFTRRFPSEDDYEQWLEQAGERVHMRVHILRVKHAAAGLFGRHLRG
ncbi:MAG: hypothetical protein ACREQI_01195 [Candidatus Binataceae bacterium]